MKSPPLGVYAWEPDHKDRAPGIPLFEFKCSTMLSDNPPRDSKAHSCSPTSRFCREKGREHTIESLLTDTRSVIFESDVQTLS